MPGFPMLHLILAVPPPDQTPGSPDGGAGGLFSGLLPFLLILFVFMILMPLFSKKENNLNKEV